MCLVPLGYRRSYYLSDCSSIAQINQDLHIDAMHDAKLAKKYRNPQLSLTTSSDPRLKIALNE